MDKNQQKEKFEGKISRIASEIFALDAARRAADSDDAEYKMLRTKLTDTAWRWATLTFGMENVEKAGVEIMQCVNRCVTNYKDESKNDESDAFLHYLSAALKTEIERAYERNAVQKSRNITFPEKKQRKLQQMIRYAELYGKDISDSRTQEMLAAAFCCSATEIAELVRDDALSKAIPERAENADGEEVLLLETAGVFARSGYKTAEEKTVLTMELERWLKNTDDVFTLSQERTKPYLSALITHRILTELENAKVDQKAIENLLCGKRFADTEKAHEVIRSFFDDGEFVRQEKVAAWFKKDKSDASRTMKNFLEKMEKYERESVN